MVYTIRMLQKQIFIIVGLFLAFQIGATNIDAEPYYLKVKAKKGDGILSLLRRYDLNHQTCNLEKFYALNALNKGDELLKGKEYYLPIKIFTYNGKSIRSTISIDDYKKAVRIKSYNEKIKKKNLRKTDYTKSKILWVPVHEIECYTSPTPPPSPSGTQAASGAKIANPVKNTTKKKSKHLYVPLFGDKYKDVPIISDRLKGKVYYLVSGHGGPDPGARCTKECSNTLCEDEYAYDVTLRLARNLMQHGATAHVIIKDKNDGIRDAAYLDCDKDEVCMDNQKIPVNQKKRLAQRANAINDLYKMYKKRGVKEQKAIMVHVDSRSVEKRQDVFFYYYKHSSRSKNLAANCHKIFKQKYEKYRKGRGYHGFIKDRGLYMLKNTLPPAVFVELANIRNKNDQQRIIQDDNRQLLANWLYEGMTGEEFLD